MGGGGEPGECTGRGAGGRRIAGGDLGFDQAQQ